jgi:hypothetical protein
MSIFDENINIEYLESLGFSPCIRNTRTGEITQMVRHVIGAGVYGCSASIYYMFNKSEENVLVDFRGIISSTKYFETITDKIGISALVLKVDEMIDEDVNYFRKVKQVIK